MLTMQKNLDALEVGRLKLNILLLIKWYLQVPQESFLLAAKSMTRQITPAILLKYSNWGRSNGGQWTSIA
jgi:hypothetical protein